MKSTEFINESKTPYDHLIGKETATMKGGVRYPGTIEKIVQDQYGNWKAKAVFSNEPGSYFYKEIGDGGLTEGDDRNLEDVRNNHPEVYKFITSLAIPLTVYRVSTYDAADIHHVVIRLQTKQDFEEVKANISRQGHRFEYMTDIAKGKTDSFDWKVENERGLEDDVSIKWTFMLPLSE